MKVIWSRAGSCEHANCARRALLARQRPSEEERQEDRGGFLILLYEPTARRCANDSTTCRTRAVDGEPKLCKRQLPSSGESATRKDSKNCTPQALILSKRCHDSKIPPNNVNSQVYMPPKAPMCEGLANASNRGCIDLDCKSMEATRLESFSATGAPTSSFS